MMAALVLTQSDPNASAAAAGFLVIFFVIAVVSFVAYIGCGYWAAKIMRRKGRSGGAGWGLGLFLGIFGVIIASCLSIDPLGLEAQKRGVPL